VVDVEGEVILLKSVLDRHLSRKEQRELMRIQGKLIDDREDPEGLFNY
jgi:hypothetical protein